MKSTIFYILIAFLAFNAYIDYQISQIPAIIPPNFNSKRHLDIKTIDTYSRLKTWVMTKSYKISDDMADELIKYTMTNCKHPKLVLAIGARESGFNPFGESRKGAAGMNQVMYSVWSKPLREAGIIRNRRDLFDWKRNILASDYIIDVYHKQYKGVTSAILKAYVGGNVESYFKDVNSNLYELKQLVRATTIKYKVVDNYPY